MPDSLTRMHALRERTLLRAVEAMRQGRRLTLTDVLMLAAWATR